MASSSGSWKYDVFLSFRGEDTRKTFVDHLYYALEQRAIRTYKDDVTLARGDTIGPSLLKAIEESQILVIIFSENYADSSWCLDELSHIMKCKQERGKIVMPIFYHVDPSDVRKQKRKYQEAFAKHELSENNKNKVESWKKALVDASNIAGWEPTHVANGHEAKCIQEIVGNILDKFPSSSVSAVEDEDLVGMGTRLKDLKRVLRIGSGGVRMVGIWGIGGGGKTTLATSIYMQISANFDGCCFVENIREESKLQNGLKSLQEKILSAVFDKKTAVQSVELGKHTIKRMLSRRNVLIVLDDVDHLDQLKALAGCRKWFGDGSRIIITTRDEHLLTTHRVDAVSPISLLSHEEVIRLFNKHAYNEDNPLQDYEMLSQNIVSYAAGLPLALIVLGSFLYDKDKDEWHSTLGRLKAHPEMDIVKTLKISYDGLKDVEKELFLDIACFFRWKSKDEAMVILDACGFYPVVGVKVLIQKALISVSKNGKFDMHDLVQEMAHYIVRGEHPDNPEKHSRVWRREDIEDMCSRNATTENDNIEAIGSYVHCHSSNFVMLVSNMKKLRFLQVATNSFDEGPSFLSTELRYIYWAGYPASPFPESFQPTKLAFFEMRISLQKELWKGYKYLPYLKELELSWMKALVRTPDFGGLPCLQKLILKACGSLEEIHPSIGNHSSLVYIEVNYCNKLTRFPSIVRMEKLETLLFYSCRSLTKFPKIEANMDSLVQLSLYVDGMEVLPSSVGEHCPNLISLYGCSKLKSIEVNFHALKCLQNLILDMRFLESSKKQLILSQLPRCLRYLNLGECGLKDGDIPSHIGELSNLQELHLRSNKFTRLDFSLSRLASLKLLDLSNCPNLVELPELPSNLAILNAYNCPSLEAIREEIHRNCKWLCEVSIWGGIKKRIGGDRLLETMLQGNAVERGCVFLEVDVEGLEIPKGFQQGGRCSMELPGNWYDDFSGFLLRATSDVDFEGTMITMKHEEEENGGWMGMGDDSLHDDFLYSEEEDSVDDDDDDDVDDVDDEDDDDVDYTTWVRYIPFSLLRHTSWWDPTSTAILMEINSLNIIRGCGLKLVPKRGAAESSGRMETTTTTTHSSSEISLDDDHHYKCKFYIEHDSKSAFRCTIERFGW